MKNTTFLKKSIKRICVYVENSYYWNYLHLLLMNRFFILNKN